MFLTKLKNQNKFFVKNQAIFSGQFNKFLFHSLLLKICHFKFTYCFIIWCSQGNLQLYNFKVFEYLFILNSAYREKFLVTKTEKNFK